MKGCEQMRINKTKSKNKEHYSIIRDINKNGKRTTCIYENIGNLEKLKQRAGDMEPIEWLNNYVKDLNEVVTHFLVDHPQVHVNNNDNSIPYVINFSVRGVTSHRVVDLLNQKGIYLSSKTSCCPLEAPSKLVYAMTRDNSLAASSIRLSLSYLTTPDEIEEFEDAFDEVLNEIMGV